jgi:nucleotide-binding universal stress UspA family protein
LKESQSYLDVVVSKFQSKSIACKTLVPHGPLAERIIEAANTKDVGLIAITSHGYEGLTRIFYGSS